MCEIIFSASPADSEYCPVKQSDIGIGLTYIVEALENFFLSLKLGIPGN